jgi:diacylglycerol kinase
MNKFLRSFTYAFAGLIELILKGRNFRIELLALLSVLILGFYFQITSSEWLIVLLISAHVLALEAINTAIEKLCDLYTTETHPQIKRIKDIAAGAVLISAIFAFIIAIVIFKKYILILIS